MSKKPPTDEDFLKCFGIFPSPIFKVTIHRSEPLAYAGYLDTIEVHEPGDISIGTLISLYGGGKYSLRIKDTKGRYIAHRTILICGHPRQPGRPSARERSQHVNSDSLRGEIDQLRAEQNRLVQTVEALARQVILLSTTQ